VTIVLESDLLIDDRRPDGMMADSAAGHDFESIARTLIRQVHWGLGRGRMFAGLALRGVVVA
jgi:hypothetical protein